MGKVFITDEVNDMDVAQVTRAKKLKVETGAAKYKMMPSACSTASGGYTISNASCYLKKVIVGRAPLAAAVLYLFDTSAHGNNSADGAGASSLTSANASAGAGQLASFGISGTNRIAALYFDASGQLSGQSGTGTYPKEFDFNVFCSSGLVATVGDCGIVDGGAAGGLQNVTFVYQT
jgi:hypothetical protein